MTNTGSVNVAANAFAAANTAVAIAAVGDGIEQDATAIGGTDADALDHVTYGVNIARKAGLEPRQILNCRSLEEVEAYFAERKQAGPT